MPTWKDIEEKISETYINILIKNQTEDMKKNVLLFLFLSFMMNLSAGNVVIRVTNPTSIQRHELVSTDVSLLRKTMKIDSNEPFIVRNAAKNEVPYQITYDGKLLIDVVVHPKETASLTVSNGTPSKMKESVKGALYKIRKDDIAWENDRGAYRVYGPALQRTGEQSFGIDIWVKNTPDLVVEQRYLLDAEGNKIGDKLTKEGKKEAADSVDRASSFHLDHGNGMDGYGVGPTLGCGTPALMNGGKLVYPYCYKTYKILDNGPLRFTVELVYNSTTIGENTNVVEHRIISLDKGSNFNKMEVWYEGLSHLYDVASGVVLHGQEDRVVLGKNYVQYADPTDAPKRNNSEIYVACLYPNGNVTTMIQKEDKSKGINASHALGINKGYKQGDKFVYYFGSAWSEYDCRSQAEWQLRINEYLESLKNPLIVEINNAGK